MPSVSYEVKPNVKDVINQNQGFVVEVTVTNDQIVPLKDGILTVTGVSDTDITVGPSLNFPVNIPEVPKNGGEVTVQIAFETDEAIITGNKTIDFEFEAFVGVPRAMVIGTAPSFPQDITVQMNGPVWSDSHTETIQIYPE